MDIVEHFIEILKGLLVRIVYGLSKNEEDVLILCRKCHREEHKQTSLLNKDCGVKE